MDAISCWKYSDGTGAVGFDIIDVPELQVSKAIVLFVINNLVSREIPIREKLGCQQ